MLSLLLIAGYTAAKPVSKQKATQIAREFLAKKSLKQNIKLNEIQPRGLRKSGSQEQDLYIFNNETNKAFVIVSGDDCAMPILAYSTCKTIDENNLPPALQWWIEASKIYVQQCARNQETPAMQVKAGSPIVKPLLENIHWGQADPYNRQCPTYEEYAETKHYYVGCVSTAATQIMKYYNHPAQGEGSKTYTDTGSKKT